MGNEKSPGAASGDPEPVHRALYGEVVASSFPFTHHLAPAQPPAGLQIHHRPGETAGPAGREAIWVSPLRHPDGTPDCRLDRRPGEERLRFHGAGDFLLSGRRITVAVPDGDDADRAELRLLGPVLAYWLELRGIPALHASAVVHPAGAAAFLASHGGGKSLLAAALMAEAGLPLLADDVVAVEAAGPAFLARPSYPQMRLAADDAERLTGRADLPPVLPGLPKRRVPVGAADGFGTFHGEALPLARLYLPRRGDVEAPEVAPVGPAEALLALVEHSFLARLAAGAGLQPQRLATLARLVENVPVRRLAYPSGRQHLAAVARAVLADLRRS